MSHSNILKFKVAVATVSWVSVLKLRLWQGFWACQFQQQRFELTIVTREVLRIFYSYRSWDPGEGKGGVLFFRFQL